LYIDNMSNDTTYIHDVTLKMLKQERWKIKKKRI